MSESDRPGCEFIIPMPEIGAGEVPIRISTWLVQPGESVETGDRIVEVVIPGITFDVATPCQGRLIRVDAFSGDVVKPGDPLGCLFVSPVSE